VFQAGQPDEITQAYRAAMGMDRLAEYAPETTTTPAR